MTVPLTDRYVSAVLRRVPRTHRTEIERELRSAIADAVEARIDLGEEPEQAELAALTELGAPERFAAGYSSGSAVLIGPVLYPDYVLVLRIACLVVLPIVFVLNDIGYWLRGDDAGAVIFGPLGITLTSAMYVLVAVTALFVLLDRVHRPKAGEEQWSPELLLGS